MKKILGLLVITLTSLHVTAKPPKAPEGYKWVKQEECTDEFNGKKLDKKKWHGTHPYWKGRSPGLFVKESVTVEDGMLRIRNHMLKKPKGKWKIGCGAVVSKSSDLFFGYYEVRMKASYTGMSSTFWFTNRPKDGDKQELDVIETIGNCRRFPTKNRKMPANTHYFTKENGKKIDAQEKGSCKVDPPTNETFHTYACWWIDENTIKYYLNDEYQFTINPSTEYREKPFHRPMYMCMVTETYNWEPVPPASDFEDPVKASTYYDWVRGWKLVKITDKEAVVEKRKIQKEKTKKRNYGKEAMERLKRRMRSK